MEQKSSKKSAYWTGGITYQVFVQSFYDSNGDGIGDINGLNSKLDYIADLGAEAIWLMPIHPSPTYHKYDVTNYYGIHPDYGTLNDFKLLMQEAQKRDLKIIIDLVLNHTSSEHPWFIESAKGKTNPYRNFYIWADMDSIKKIGETKEATGDSDNLYLWNEAAGNEEQYFSFFWKYMPDLNFDEPKVREEIYKIGKFWLTEIGVDGFRLDAARHIYPEERIHDSVAWWKVFREEMEKVKADVFLVGEVWGEAKDVAPFLKGLHSIFNFDQCFALQSMLKSEDTNGFLDSLFATYTQYNIATDKYYDGIFTTNHDQNRILSELEEDIIKGKLAASIILTLPGSPFIYYGEELGMLGEKPDEQIREPFLWSHNNDKGQTKWIEAKFNTPDKVLPLSQQKKDKASIYHHYKNLITLRKGNSALKQGSISQMKSKHKTLLAYKRFAASQEILVLHNVGKKPLKFKVDENVKTLFSTIDDSTFEGIIPAYSSFILEIEQ
jgi:glycosidase